MPLAIEHLRCLETNYTYLLCQPETRRCAVVDPADETAAMRAVRDRGLTVSYILNTHHHADHTGGNLVLKKAFGALVCGAASDRGRIPGLDIGLDETSSLELFGARLTVLETPGHTTGSLCFLLGDALFTGDTLFAMGCGRLFEGDAATMYDSFVRLGALPDKTRVYPGHDYALADARFAVTLEPGNARLRARLAVARAGGIVPGFALSDERATNPYFRTESAEIRATLKMAGASEPAVFSEIRRRKDMF